MQGLFKMVMWSAPVAVIVIVLTFFMNREHSVEMQVESASFDRDFNRFMSSLEKDPADKKAYKHQMKVAQQRYSSANVQLQQRRQKVDRVDQDISKELDDFNLQSKGGQK